MLERGRETEKRKEVKETGAEKTCRRIIFAWAALGT
jgi:hypothetical protein